MTKVPIELRIKSIFPKQRGHVVMCTELLRHVPGKRRVYAGRLDDKPVIAKIYGKKLRAKSQLLDEWSKMNCLAQAGLDCPKLHFYGRTEKGEWVIVTEYIANSATALELYYKAGDAEKKLDVLRPVFTELARLHKAGIFQKDLHLGNFLISNNRVFSLDTATMRFQSRPLKKRQSLKQLAILSWYVPQEVRDRLPGLMQKHAHVRGWEITSDDEKHVKKYMQKHITKEIRRQLKKTLRTSGRQVRMKDNGMVAVFDKTFYENPDVARFLSKIDGLMETGQILKSRPTSFLSRITINDSDIVIKRYNHKGLAHSIRQSLQRSRARRSWLHAHRLRMLGIDTPKPIAYIEKRIGPVLWQSYVLTMYIEGRNLDEILTNPNMSEQRKQNIYRQISEIMTALHKNHITHGDFKRTNFIITDDRVYITDLDAMKLHLCRLLFKRRRAKDISRLERMFQ